MPSMLVRLGRVAEKGFAEKGFAVCALLLLPGRWVVWQGFIFAVYAVTLLLLVLYWRSVRTLLGVAWPLLLPVLLAASSVLWSVDSGLSLYRMIELAGTTVFGTFLAIRFSLKDQLRILAVVLGIVACASVLVVLFLPQHGVMPAEYEGAWSGIFHHKNNFGRMVALAAFVFTLLVVGDRELRPFALLGMGLSLALVLASKSQASLLVTIAGFAVIGVLLLITRFFRSRRSTVLLVAMCVVTSLAVWTLHHDDSLLALLGRDRTLTGRVELWTVLLQKAGLRPWLGYGYGAFWRGTTGMSVEVQEAIGWYPIHAHNGFLDLWLELGITGLLMFLLPLSIYGYQTYRWGVLQRSPLCLWPLVYLSFFVLSNLAESALVRQNTIYWALYVAAVLTVQKHAHDSDSRRQLGRGTHQLPLNSSLTSGHRVG